MNWQFYKSICSGFFELEVLQETLSGTDSALQKIEHRMKLEWLENTVQITYIMRYNN